MTDGDSRPRPQDDAKPRKPYRRPALVELGSVDELTSGAHGSNLDGIHGVSGS